MKSVMNLLLKLSVTFSLVAMFAACGSEDANEDDFIETDTLSVEDTQSLNQAQKVFYTLPSPFEVAAMLKSSGVDFNDEILNSVDKLSSYETSRAKAINLGVYGTDLSFASIFEQTRTSMIYMSVVKKLCDDLGISNAFNSATMERLEQNKENQDSVQQIVADAYLMANTYLKENEKADASALILAGGWAEGLYIATQLANPDNPNEDLLLMIAEQKYSLENLIALLEGYQGGSVEDILSDMRSLYEIYESVEESEAQAVESKTLIDQKMTVIGGGSDIKLSNETLAAITSKITEIRNSYVQ